MAVSGNAIAGWYRVINYVGQIGTSQIHFSIQKYNHFGSGITVLGSYYYNKYLSPILVYGLENDDKSLTLCEARPHEEYEKALIHDFKNGADAVGCPLHLTLTNDGAIGEWRDSSHSYSVSLKQVGNLDDTAKEGVSIISGDMEIPFWGQTKRHTFIGVYQASYPEEVKIEVIDKKTGTIVQTIIPDPYCTRFGYFMTPIYMNLESGYFDLNSRYYHSESFYLNCWSSQANESRDYLFDKKAGKFRQSRNR